MATEHRLDQAAPTPVVDVHAHVALPEVEAVVAGRPELEAARGAERAALGGASAAENEVMVRARASRLTDPAARVAHMTATGIDVQVVSVSPAQYHPWADPGLARALSALVNEGVAAHCAHHPGRLTGLGTAPLQHPALTVAALEHAVLECGLAGVEVSTYAPRGAGAREVDLSEPDLEPFWTRATELGALVLLHPFGCSLGTRLDRWYLANTVGQPLEHAVALSHLIFGGVLDRHPGLRVLAAHGGGYLPAHLGRSDHAWHARRDAHSCAAPPSSYLSRIFVDSLVLDPAELRRLVRRMGAERVLLGSDHPFDMGDPAPLSTLEAAGLEPEEFDLVAGGNARRLGLVPGHAGADARASGARSADVGRQQPGPRPRSHPIRDVVP